jgi:hypothetical protein
MQWGGTPVSWRQVRTCSAGGATYSVLTQGNFQGPPPSSAEFRCGNTVSASGSSQSSFKPVQVRLHSIMLHYMPTYLDDISLSWDTSRYITCCNRHGGASTGLAEI